MKLAYFREEIDKTFEALKSMDYRILLSRAFNSLWPQDGAFSMTTVSKLSF